MTVCRTLCTYYARRPRDTLFALKSGRLKFRSTGTKAPGARDNKLRASVGRRHGNTDSWRSKHRRRLYSLQFAGRKLRQADFDFFFVSDCWCCQRFARFVCLWTLFIWPELNCLSFVSALIAEYFIWKTGAFVCGVSIIIDKVLIDKVVFNSVCKIEAKINRSVSENLLWAFVKRIAVFSVWITRINKSIGNYFW